MHITAKNCAFMVKDGKVWCKTHNTTVRKVDNEIDDWELHPWQTHEIDSLPFQHVLYTANYCKTCNTGKLLIDEEQ